MITKDEIQELLHSTETYRVERTTSTDERSKSRGQARLDYALQGGRRREPAGDMDKIQEAICAFANDLSGSRKKGYLILRAYDNGGKTGGKVGGDVVENIVENIAENIVDSIVEKLSTTRAKIVRIIWKNPNATALSISKEIDIASRNVQEHLRKLQEQGGSVVLAQTKVGTGK